MPKTLILNPIWGLQIFFHGLFSLLVIRKCSKLRSYAISRKNIEPNLKKWQKNLILDPILAHLAQIWDPNCFLWILALIDVLLDFSSGFVASYHFMQFQGKLTNQTRENGKKPSFGTDFFPFGPNLGPKKFFRRF